MKILRPYQQQAVKETWSALKESDDPVLLMASVGAGKSLMLADILIYMQNAGKRALCVVNNAELVRNNCETFRSQGGKSSIYCASLNEKCTKESVIFGTPQSILNGINKNEPISQIKFNIIIVDEAHNINHINHCSSFMRILRHYKQEYPSMRLLGATGTNFRFKGASIVGDQCLFKKQVGNITTHWLIENRYLVKPLFKVDESLIIDFSNVKIKNGQFDKKELEIVVSENVRLTELICYQIVKIMENQCRKGVFIFATTKKHAYEILSHLPNEESAIILGETTQDERTEILDKARGDKIKYIVNISIVSVGVDVPIFDTVAYLRPTESLVLLVQTMGRGLRLHEGKSDALVLDFAGNIERHSHWDDPILLDAVKQTIDKDKPLVILCPQCGNMNTEHARRCVSVKEDKRCDYYFEFKECPNEKCTAKNDIAARHCHACKTEIIDPNAKLKLDRILVKTKELEVIEVRYGVSDTKNYFRINAAYKCKDKNGRLSTFYENYTPSTPKARNVFYGQFVRKHCEKPSDWYMHLENRDKVEEMLKIVRNPTNLLLKFDGDEYRISKKVF